MDIPPVKSITGIVIDMPSDTQPIVNNALFQASECTIPAGSSICMSKLIVNAPSGKTFSVKNVTRNIRTSSIISSKNYHTIIGWTVPVYSTNDTTNPESANMIRYGENRLDLYEGTLKIGSTITQARCIDGASWDGKTCNTLVTEPITNPPVSSTDTGVT